MALEIMKTGVIVNASKNFSVVKVPIDDVDTQFLFSKGMFYTFGFKCEGHMSNILEQGMEVNVLYKLGLNQNPFITAVWLGTKPENLKDITSELRSIFGQWGRLAEVSDSYFLVKCDDFEENVLVKKSVVYRDGYLLDKDTSPFVSVGEIVTFDAIPLHRELEASALTFSPLPRYMATCAWVGDNEPRLVDRFGLAARDLGNNESDQDLDFQDVEGIVTVVPNDVVAFVDVDLNGVVDTVLLFRSSITSDQSAASKSLKDLVAVGDALSLRIRRVCFYSGRKQWFAVEACQLCAEIPGYEKQTYSLQSVGTASGVEIEAEVDSGASHAMLADSFDRIALNDSPKFTDSSRALFSDPSLCGCISRVSFDSAIISFKNLNIYVDMSDVYVDGSLCTPDQFVQLVSSGKREVKFEAVSSLCNMEAYGLESRLLRIHSHIQRKFRPTHTASCAWIGEKPSLSVISSALGPPDLFSLECKNRTFVGYVFKFRLPDVAFIHLPLDGPIVTMHLSDFRQSVGKPSTVNFTIADFVKLGEYFEFRIRLWNKLLTAFDTTRVGKTARKQLHKIRKKKKAAKKAQCQMSVAVTKVLKSSLLEPTESESTIVATDPDLDLKSSSLEPTESTIVATDPDLALKSSSFKSSNHQSMNVAADPDVDKPVTNISKNKLRPFEKSHIFKGQYRLLCFTGKLNQVTAAQTKGGSKVSFQLEHELGSSPIDAPIVHGANDSIPINSKTFSSCSSRDICFDAVVFDDASDKLCFHVERMWLAGKSREPPHKILRRELCYRGNNVLEPCTRHLGTIDSIPLYDCAIAVVNEIPVLVTSKSLVFEKPVPRVKRINGSYTCIDSFLKVGDKVAVVVVKGFDLYKALYCWSSKCAKEAAKEKESSNTFRPGSRDSLSIQSWKSDDFYGKGSVARAGAGYFVHFTTPIKRKLSKTLALDLFANDKVFVDGKFIGLNEADRLVGREMSFSVAYSPEKEEKGIAPHGLYVDYAWAGEGEGPLPWAALDHRLSVPKGVLCSNLLFEAVVECIQGKVLRGVPEHVVCSIGPLPVLVPYTAAESSWAAKERVCLRVQEQSHGTETALVCTDIEDLRSFTNVLKLKGKVVTSPNPVGIIKTVNNVEVCFELCHVQDKATFGCDLAELSEWFRRVSEGTCVGATVNFTAVKMDGITHLYRALEVWVKNTE